jgi:energy-coupling factor transport system ATP-binding protein
LFDIDLSISAGEKILIVGPSGSGKSTLGHCLNGLIPFSFKGSMTGELALFGLAPESRTIFDMSKHIGTVLQDSDGQFVGLTVGEDIAFSMENDCVPVSEMHERVRKTAELVGMDGLLKSSPYELSGGQKQRTSLAGVMVEDVDALLFDEPLANLDPATGKAAIEIIDDIHRRTGKAIIIIEHRLEDVLHRHVDRIITVADGRIVADSDADSLLCSDILREHGIREPLYITAMKYAGIPVTPDIRPGHIETLDIEAVAPPLRAWFASEEPKPPSPQREAILKVQNLSFSYLPGKEVLKDICFEIGEGEMVSIVGRNGAGKSTLTKLLCGFEKPTGGAMFYRGEDMKDHTIRERAEYIGLVMQNPNQMISETMIADEVGLGLKLRGVPEGERAERVGRALEVCGLSPFSKWPVSALSFGQKKRVTVASMLVLDPKILILDEPTAGQDYRHYTEIMRFLRGLVERGVTVILITHDMHLMLEYTPRAITLSEGSLICDAPSSRILTDSAVIEAANLKETSLFSLAKLTGIEDSAGFVQAFVDHESEKGYDIPGAIA